jgi:hypothetical protein
MPLICAGAPVSSPRVNLWSSASGGALSPARPQCYPAGSPINHHVAEPPHGRLADRDKAGRPRTTGATSQRVGRGRAPTTTSTTSTAPPEDLTELDCKIRTNRCCLPAMDRPARRSCLCGRAAATFLAAAVVEEEHSEGVLLLLVRGESLPGAQGTLGLSDSGSWRCLRIVQRDLRRVRAWRVLPSCWAV